VRNANRFHELVSTCTGDSGENALNLVYEIFKNGTYVFRPNENFFVSLGTEVYSEERLTDIGEKLMLSTQNNMDKSSTTTLPLLSSTGFPSITQFTVRLSENGDKFINCNSWAKKLSNIRKELFSLCHSSHDDKSAAIKIPLSNCMKNATKPLEEQCKIWEAECEKWKQSLEEDQTFYSSFFSFRELRNIAMAVQSQKNISQLKEATQFPDGITKQHIEQAMKDTLTSLQTTESDLHKTERTFVKIAGIFLNHIYKLAPKPTLFEGTINGTQHLKHSSTKPQVFKVKKEDDSYLAILGIFLKNHKRIPLPREIMFVDINTTFDQIKNFLLPWSFFASEKEHDKRKESYEYAFGIVGLHRAPKDVISDLSRFLTRISFSEKNKSQPCPLYIIYEDHPNIQFQGEIVDESIIDPIPSKSFMGHPAFQHSFSHSEIVSSKLSGEGKTTSIMMNSLNANNLYCKIPFDSSTSLDSFTQMLISAFEPFSSSSLAPVNIHIDIGFTTEPHLISQMLFNVLLQRFIISNGKAIRIRDCDFVFCEFPFLSGNIAPENVASISNLFRHSHPSSSFLLHVPKAIPISNSQRLCEIQLTPLKESELLSIVTLCCYPSLRSAQKFPILPLGTEKITTKEEFWNLFGKFISPEVLVQLRKQENDHNGEIVFNALSESLTIIFKDSVAMTSGSQMIIPLFGGTMPHVVGFIKMIAPQIEKLFNSTRALTSNPEGGDETSQKANFLLLLLILQNSYLFAFNPLPVFTSDNLVDMQIERCNLPVQWTQNPLPYVIFNRDIRNSRELFSPSLVFIRNDSNHFFKSKTETIFPNLLTAKVEELISLQPSQEVLITLSPDKKNGLYNFEHLQKIAKLLGGNPNETNREILNRPSYIVTSDVFVKALFIHNRLCSGSAVILQGETGSGKTRLIRFISDLLGKEFFTLNVHGGTTIDTVVKFMKEKPLAFLEKEENKKQAYVFFDEVNTSIDALWLIKELICDRTCLGVPIPDTICFVAALNPYRKRKLNKGNSLDYATYLQESSKTPSSPPSSTCFSSTKNSLATIDKELSKLVYRVYPLPEALIISMWNFGSPSTDFCPATLPDTLHYKLTNESLYFLSMHERFGTLKREPPLQHTVEWDAMGVYMASFIACAHRKLREWRDVGEVSMRDADRAFKLVPFFFELYKNFPENLKQNTSSQSSQPQRILQSSMWMAIIVTYYVRLNAEEREELLKEFFITYKEMFTHLKSQNPPPSHHPPYQWFGYSEHNFRKFLSIGVFEHFISSFISLLPLEKGIARNTALMENVFMLFVCICNGINLFIVGPPGTSKSLAVDILASSMYYGRSNEGITGQFFEKYPTMEKFLLQCHPTIKTEAIEETFKKAANSQFKNRKIYKNTHLCVAVLDELALADLSPFRPMKIVHTFSDDKVPVFEGKTIVSEEQVLIIGTSNWSIDSANMNRGLTLVRSNPTPEDLKATAISIISSQNLEQKEKEKDLNGELVKSKIEGIASFYDQVSKDTATKWFFGLRDMYDMIKLLHVELDKSGGNISSHLLLHVMLRSFGGLLDKRLQSKVITLFKKHLNIIDDDKAEFITHEGISMCKYCARAHMTLLKSISLAKGEPIPQEPDTLFTTIGVEGNCKYLIDENLPFVNSALVAANLQDHTARHCLIISEDPGMQSLVTRLVDKNRSSVLFGSVFPDDSLESKRVGDLKQVQNAMSAGRTIILVNCSHLYESLYDVLNRHYAYYQGKAYARLGYGSHGTLCVVHEQFKCIVVVSAAEAPNLYPPFRNRFEKQVLSTHSTLSSLQAKAAQRIEEGEILCLLPRASTFAIKSVVSSQTIPGMTCSNIEQENIAISTLVENSCKKLINCASSILLTKWLVEKQSLNSKSQAHSRFSFDEKKTNSSSFVQQQHLSLMNQIEDYFESTNHESLVKLLFSSSSRLICAITHSFSFSVDMNEVETQLNKNGKWNVYHFFLDKILNEYSLMSMIANYQRSAQESKGNTKSILFVFCDINIVGLDAIKQSQLLIGQFIQHSKTTSLQIAFVIHVPLILSSQEYKLQQEQEQEQEQKGIISQKEISNSFQLFFLEGWDTIFVDQIQTLQSSLPKLSELLRKQSDLSQILTEEKIKEIIIEGIPRVCHTLFVSGAERFSFEKNIENLKSQIFRIRHFMENNGGMITNIVRKNVFEYLGSNWKSKLFESKNNNSTGSLQHFIDTFISDACLAFFKRVLIYSDSHANLTFNPEYDFFKPSETTPPCYFDFLMEQIKQEKQWKFNGAISSLLMMESIDGSRIEFENTQTRISLEPCQILPSFKTSFPFFSDISSFINRLFENEKYSVENSQNQFDSISDNSSLLRARFSLKLPWLIGESYDLDDLTLKSNIHHYVNNLVCGSLSAIGVRKSVGFSFSVTVSSICKSIEPQGISLPTVYAVWWGLYKSFALAGTAISFSSDSLKGSNDEEISEILESLRIDPSSNITAQLLSVVWKIWLEHTNCQRKGSISSVLNRSLLAQPSVLSLWHQIPPSSKMDETLQLNWLCWCLLVSTATNPIKSDAEAIWPTINNFKKQILSQTQKDISRLETLWENLPYVLSSMQGIIPSFISVVSSGDPQSSQSNMDTYLAKCCVELLINYSTISPLSKIKKVSESECSCLASCLMSLYEKNQRTSPIIPQLISQAIHSSGGPNGAIGILFMHIISLRLSESKKSNDADYLCEKVNSFINLLEHYTTSQTSNEKLITSEGDLFEVLLASHASSLFRIAVKILNEPKSKDVSRLNQKSISGIRKSIEQIMKRKPTASEYRILFLRLLTQDGTLEKSDVFLFPEQTTILTKEFVEEIKEFKDYSEKPSGELIPVNFLMVLGLPATINLLNNDNSDFAQNLLQWRDRVKDALKGSTVRNIQFYEQYLILLAIAYNVVSKKETNKETLNIIFKEISPSSQRERNVVVEVGTFLSQLSSSRIPDCLKKFLISGDEKCQSFLHFLCHLAVFGTKLSKLSGMQSELSVFGRILEEPQNGCNMFLPSCPFSSVEKAVQHEPEANWVYTCPNKHPFITGQCEHITNSIVKCEICGEQIGAVKYGSATTGTTFLGHTLTIATQIASGAHPYLLTKGFDDTSLLGVGRKDYSVSSFSGLTLSALAMQRLLLNSSILLSATINPLASVAQVSRYPILSIEGFFSDMLRTLETGHCEALRKLGIPNNVDCFRIIHAIVNKADERLFSHSQENNLLTDLANYQVSSIFEKEFHRIFTDPILSQWGTISMQMNANNQSSANVKCISDLREQLTKRSIAIKEVELRFDKSPSCLSKLIFPLILSQP